MERFTGRRERQRQNPRDVLALTLLDPGQFVEVAHLACNLHGNFAGIKMRNAPDPGRACEDSFTKCVPTYPIGAHRTHARNHDSPQTEPPEGVSPCKSHTRTIRERMLGRWSGFGSDQCDLVRAAEFAKCPSTPLPPVADLCEAPKSVVSKNL